MDHLDIYTFIHWADYKDEQNKNETQRLLLQFGNEGMRKKIKFKCLDERIQRLKNRLLNWCNIALYPPRALEFFSLKIKLNVRVSFVMVT